MVKPASALYPREGCSPTKSHFLPSRSRDLRDGTRAKRNRPVPKSFREPVSYCEGAEATTGAICEKCRAGPKKDFHGSMVQAVYYLK